MFFKIIDGLTRFMYNIVIFTLVMLGVYAMYEIVFNMDIPIPTSLLLIVFIFAVSYFITSEDKKVSAVPVMVVEKGKPMKVDLSKVVS